MCARRCGCLKILAFIGAALLVLIAGWTAWRPVRPVILTVQAIAPDSREVVIEGHGFGASGQVVFSGKGERVQLTYSGGPKITVALPVQLYGAATVQVFPHWLGHLYGSNCWPLRFKSADLPSQPNGYEVPVEADAPWPEFRRDRRNTGSTPLPAAYAGDAPWTFHTEKGIFSTPVISGDGTVYVGSADHYFYALNPDGTLKWKFKTGGIIDSAAALHQPEPGSSRGPVTFISGDGIMYHLRTDGGPADPQQRVLWTFDASHEPGAGYLNWWEGNVAVGYDGTIFAGNTNWNYYAIHPDGTVKWKYATGSNNWSMAAYGDDGVIYLGSLDTQVRAILPNGTKNWSKRTLGMIAASAAIGADGTVYVGSFDSYFYALDPQTGKTKWSFKTGNHIYSSAALTPDAVYFGSTDGVLYALDTSGKLKWSYETGDPIRSSPAVGRAPEGEQGGIVYFGNGKGVLYALNTRDGSRRWSYDTTPEPAELRDRNDLNGSPALGKTGVYIGGEHGNVCYVPYDYPLHHPDPRACVRPEQDAPPDGVHLDFVTPGGSTLAEAPATIGASAVLTFRLTVRQQNKTGDARMQRSTTKVEVTPAFPYTLETSADGHFLHLRPLDLLTPGTAYTVALSGDYRTGGMHLGNLTFGGSKAGVFSRTFTFRTAGSGTAAPPFTVGPTKVAALELTRLAVPIPAMMPSLNQIGFDYFDCILSTVAVADTDSSGNRKVVCWMTGAERGDDGVLRAAPKPDLMFPLNGVFRGDQFILRNEGFNLTVQGVRIPFKLLEFRGQLNPDHSLATGACTYGEADALSVPSFGPLLVLAGLANDVYRKLVVFGTYVTRAYDERGMANLSPEGVAAGDFAYVAPSRFKQGSVTAHVRVAPGVEYPAAKHRPALLLLDRERVEAVLMGYLENTSVAADGKGNLESVNLTIPRGTQLPGQCAAVLILDGFPAAAHPLE